MVLTTPVSVVPTVKPARPVLPSRPPTGLPSFDVWRRIDARFYQYGFVCRRLRLVQLCVSEMDDACLLRRLDKKRSADRVCSARLSSKEVTTFVRGNGPFPRCSSKTWYIEVNR